MKVWLAAAAVSMCFCAGCSTLVATPPDGPDPRFVSEYGPPNTGPRVAIVLSGGATRGFAHIGVMKALDAYGLKPDIVLGTSAGSIVGALYASGLTGAEVESAIERMGAPAFSDLSLPGLGLIPGSLGIFRGDELRRFIDREVRHHRIEDFPIRFAAVATDLATGAPAIFKLGTSGERSPPRRLSRVSSRLRALAAPCTAADKSRVRSP